MKFRILLFLLLLATGSLWGQETLLYSTGFESGFNTGNNYQNTVTSGPAGYQWTTYYGTPSTNIPITGSISMQMRLYSNGNKGYTQTDFNLANVSRVTFKAKYAGSSVNVKVEYSTDSGSNWNGEQTFTLSTTAATYEYIVSPTGEYANVRLRFTLVGTAPSSGNKQLVIDDVNVYQIIAPSGDHTITVTQPTGGTISPETIGVEDGENQSFTATPTSACYTFSHWVVDGSNAGSANPYTFTNVTADHTITAVFNAVASSTITATAGANGSISPSGATSVACGGSQAYTITPNSGYAVADVLVNGSSVGAVTSYEFTNVTANQTIHATFEEYTGPCFTGHAPNFTTTGFTAAGDADSGGVPTTTIRLASGSNGGSVSTTANGVTAGDVTVRFRAKGWSASETQVTVAITGATSQVVETLPTSFDWVEVSFTNVSTNPTLTFSTVSGKRLHIGNVEIICTPSTPEPELTLTQSSNPILHGTGSYDFGNQLVSTSSAAVTFTIQNTGNADLTLGTIALSGANASNFSVTQVGNATLEEDQTTTFTVTFTPSSLGAKTATVTIPNNDNTNYTFTVTGVGSYSSDSDIVANTGFTYTNNINYANYQVATITNTSHSVGVFQFAVRDGGGSPDLDDLPTTLTDLAFIYTGTANTIRAAALFNGNTMITNGVVTANGISFSGLSIEAADNGSSSNITLHVTFTETVTDNEKLVFTIASATADASGSVFGSTNASGASSDTNNSNDRNRIEVTADRLAFVVHPTGASVNTNLGAFQISGIDVFDNVDLDAANSITLTTSGTGMTSSSPYTLASGSVSISDVQFDTAQTAITITATTTGLSHSNSVVSNTFDIADLAVGTYRTTSGGTWPSGTATWERLTGGGWTSATPGANTTDLLIIRHTVESREAFAATGGIGTKIQVENGGSFIAKHNTTIGSLTIKEGGVFSVNDPSVKILPDTGILRVENGGKLIFNSGTLDSADGIFAGIEEFQPESDLEIRNWHFNNTSGPKNLINSNASHYVTPNSSGYHFGNIIINASSMSGTLEVIQNTLAGTNVMLCNNFTVLSNPNNIFLVNSATNTTIGGSLIVNTGAGNKFSFSANTSANATHTVKGNIELISGSIDLNQNSANMTGNSIINLEGNLITIGGVLMNSDNGDVNTVLNFTGNNVEQTVSINPASNNTNIPFVINTGAYVKIINHDFKLGSNSKITVKSGGTLDFGFNGSTALNVTGYGTTGTGFTSEQGSYLKITSPDGIVSTSGNVGNIQTNTAPSVSPIATFHYIGKQNQVTGDAVGTSNNGRAVIVEMESDNLVLTPSTSFGFTNGTNATINNGEGGILDIRKGRFIETETNYVTGSTGHLKMAANTYYEIVKASADSSDLIPRMFGNYDITGGEIHLKSSGDQTLRGGKMYNDLTFSGGSIKTVSNSATPNISGLVAVMANTTLDVSGRLFNSFGNSDTELLMDVNSKFIVDGSGVRPQMGGYYLLDPTSTIEFTGTAATEIRVAPSYANIIISGTNVTAGTTDIAGLTIQDGTVFTIKDGATFKVPNPQGMYGNTQTAIKNSPAITFDLEANSTVEYNAAGEEQLISKLNNSYGNLALKGAGSVKKLPSIAEGNVGVKKDLSLDAEVTLDIESGKTLLVGEKLNNSGDVIVRNSANFVQLHSGSDQNVNSGNFKVERVTRPMNRSSYTYWGAPVSTTINNSGIQWLIESVVDSGNFDSQVASNQLTQIFRWNPTGQSWENAIGFATVAGDGFIAKAPNNFPSAANSRKALMAAFQGAPFNGNITKEIVPNTGGEDPYTNAKMTFMSNPYPSAINIDKFLLEYGAGLAGSTPRVVPTVYLWTHASTPTNGVYSASDFATYTLLGGTATEPTDSPIETLVPEGKIASGQGFFIRGTAAGGTVVLKNDYRFSNADTGYNNQQFFRVATDENLFERHRFWLNLKGNNGQFKQTLIGYSDIASDGVDGLDGSYYEGGNPTNLYTILDDRPFVIQAYALPFDINDEIPLGFKVGANGSYSIGLSNFDGLFEFQTIYLKDSYQDVIHNLKDSDYQFTAQAGDYTNRFKVIFKPYSCDETTIWNGTAWSNGEPMLSKKVVIQGDLTLTENMETCEMIVQSGVLTVSSGVTLTVRGKIVNTLGANHFIVENEANLVQIEEVENEGDIKVYRNSAPIKHLDYTIWSSPVEGQVLQAFSPETLPHRIYTYNSATNAWVNTGMNPAVDAFKAGEAYMFRAPNNFITTPYIYSGLFTGTPNNGTIDLTVNSNKFIGLGNPYPSNLKIDGTGGLRTQNPGIGSLYFWTNANPYDNALQSYTGNNWSVYSLIGGISASNDDFDHVSNGYIPVGQGFLVEAPSLERVTFNNQMRTSNQGVFFRIAQDEMHRYWLEFRKEEQVFNKILVGYTPESTSEFDFGIDAKLYGYNGSALYSLINEDENPYAIQGRALPFDLEDVVPLGYKAIEAGTYSISLVNLDGLFEDTDIFIKDKMLDIEHNIKSGAYEFVTESGEFLDRLEIVYRTNLNVQNPTIDNNWIAYLKDNQIQLESVGFDMKEVRVYDMLGRVVYSETNVNANKHHIHNLGANQVLIIKIVTSQGTTSVKKFQK